MAAHFDAERSSGSTDEPSPIRVLMINENIGGHETVHLHLKKAFSERGDVEAIWMDAPPQGRFRRLFGAPIPGLARLDMDLQPLRNQLGVSASLKPIIAKYADQVDVIHVYTHNAALLSARLLTARPSVVSLDTTNTLNAFRIPYREPGPGTPWLVRVTKKLEQRVYRAATLIVANSEWSYRSLRNDYGVDPAKIRDFPFGISPPPVLPPSSAIGAPRIGFLGRQFVRKGGPLLVEAFKALNNPDASLVLISPDPLAAKAAAQHPNIEVVADLTPGDPRLWEILAGLTIFAFPSPIDQAPNAVLEAMAAGLPVVGVRVAAVPEMIEENVTGLLVPREDAPAMTRALAELIADPERAAEMGRLGAERFADRYTAAVGADRLVGVLREAIRLHRSGVARVSLRARLAGGLADQ